MAVEFIGQPMVVICACAYGQDRVFGGSSSLRDAELLLNVRTDSFPSEEAQASIAPNSCGAHDTEFTINVKSDEGKQHVGVIQARTHQRQYAVYVPSPSSTLALVALSI
jgi:hypothetical protein